MIQQANSENFESLVQDGFVNRPTAKTLKALSKTVL